MKIKKFGLGGISSVLSVLHFRMTSFFIGIEPCESNSSEAIRDIDPNSFEEPSYRLGLLTRRSFEGHCLPEVPEKPEVNEKQR